MRLFFQLFIVANQEIVQHITPRKTLPLSLTLGIILCFLYVFVLPHDLWKFEWSNTNLNRNVAKDGEQIVLLMIIRLTLSYTWLSNNGVKAVYSVSADHKVFWEDKGELLVLCAFSKKPRSAQHWPQSYLLLSDSHSDDFDPASTKSKYDSMDFDSLLREAQCSLRR